MCSSGTLFPPPYPDLSGPRLPYWMIGQQLVIFVSNPSNVKAHHSEL